MKIDTDILKKMFQTALKIRRFEEEAIRQYRQGNIYGYLHPYIGEEGIAVGVISALRPDDYIVSTHRGHGHAIAKGHDLKKMFAELMGKETGYCRGRGGSMHVANMKQNNLGANGIVGGGIPIAAGAALAIKIKRTDQVVICFFSDGATNQGTFHESINMASIYNLPVIFVIENNQYAVSTRISDMVNISDLSKRAESYGIPGLTIEGNDAVTIFETMEEILKRARAGQGPTLLECKTYRYGGHHLNDPGAYMPADEMEYWKSRDPIILLENYLLKNGVSQKDIDVISRAVDKEISEAAQYGIESPEPSEEEFLEEISRQVQ